MNKEFSQKEVKDIMINGLTDMDKIHKRFTEIVDTELGKWLDKNVYFQYRNALSTQILLITKSKEILNSINIRCEDVVTNLRMLVSILLYDAYTLGWNARKETEEGTYEDK